jgi:transcriptional regulator with XRE-family HTH domain
MEMSVGSQLKRARESLGLSIEDAAQAVHIKLPYLQELEDDHPELLPSPANARGFLRLYASFLRISAQPLLELWDNPQNQETDQIPVQKPITLEKKSEEIKEEKITGIESSAEQSKVEDQEITETKTQKQKQKFTISSLFKPKSKSEAHEVKEEKTKESATAPKKEISRSNQVSTKGQKSSARSASNP